MSAQKFLELAACAKAITKEMAALARHNTVTVFADVSAKRRHGAMESARECAIEIRRLKHEAHCLAVECGIANLRSDSYYSDSTAPAGFGRATIFRVRRPEVPACDPAESNPAAFSRAVREVA